MMNVALCPCCMAKHERQTYKVRESNILNDVKVTYDALYEYCPNADEYYATEQQLRQNNMHAKDAYRKAVGLLTPDETLNVIIKFA